VNIALPALLTFLLLLPGILLSYSYRRGFFSPSRVTLGPLRDEIGVGIVWELVVHPLSLLSATSFGLWAPDVSFLYQVFAGATTDLDADTGWQVRGLFYYLITVNLGALGVGWMVHWVVRRAKLDILFPCLCFNNEWHYNFSGEARLFSVANESDWFWDRWRDIQKESNAELLRIHCAAVVPVGGASFLYAGKLDRYYFDSAGQLDQIVLQDVERIPLDALTPPQPTVDDANASRVSDDTDAPDAAGAEGEWFSIPGNFLVIQYANVQTLNFDYVVLQPSAPDAVVDASEVAN
jgi:hypothetical protein